MLTVLLLAGTSGITSHLGAQQRPDSTQRRRAKSDSVVVLAPLEVHASIAPVAGPAIGSGIPARVSTIGQDELTAWRPHLLTDAVASQPDLTLYDDLGSPKKLTVGTRGFSVGPTVGLPAGVSVFLDGVRQNEPDAQEVNFDLLPMDYVKRVELLSGTASLLGPNGIGGAINLITERGEGPAHGSVEVGGGSFGSGSLDLSASGRTSSAWDYYAGAGGDRADGWRTGTKSDASRAFVNVGRVIGDRGASLQAYVGHSRAKTAGSLPESIFDLAPQTNFTPGDVDNLELGQIALSAFTPLATGRVAVTAYLRRSHADRYNANQPPDPDVRGTTANATEGVTADWRRSFPLPVATLDARVGTDVAADQIRVRLFDVPTIAGPRVDSLTTDVSSPRLSAAAYALGDVIVGRATLSAGARYDYIRSPFDDRLESVTTTGVYRQVTPRGGVSVDLGHGARAYASVGSSFRAPALLELGCADATASCPLPFALGADPPLAPVRATSAEAGGQWLVGNVMLRGSAYRTDVRDEIFFIASPQSIVAGYFTNIAHTRRAGAELDAQGTAGEHASWSASYSATRATFRTPVQIETIRSDPTFTTSRLAGPNTVAPGDALPLIPRWQLKLGGSLDLPRGSSAGLDARRLGPQWLRGDEANETRPLDPYTVLDARVGIAHGDWDVALVVRNALDSHAAVFGTFNENRRTGELERFLTPLDARSFQFTLRRAIGPSSG